MRVYEVSVCFDCPVCRAKIIHTEMATRKLDDPEQEQTYERLIRQKHLDLHKKAIKYDQIREKTNEIMEYLRNDT